MHDMIKRVNISFAIFKTIPHVKSDVKYVDFWRTSVRIIYTKLQHTVTWHYGIVGT